MSDFHSGAPDVGKPAMGVGKPQQPGGYMAPQGFLNIPGTQVFDYLPMVMRVISNLGDIQSFIGKLTPYLKMAQRDFPDLFAEGKALVEKVAPNLLTGGEPESAKIDVGWVQRALNKVSNAGLKVDGQYGPVTHEAIRQYQTVKGLAPDGWAGPLTVAQLFKEVGANP
jgi:Putative peptidoglycan binding domain